MKGLDRARYFMNLEPYKRIFREFLGEDPYEGTFNIEVKDLSYRDLLNKCKPIEIRDFMYDGKIYGGLYIWLAEIKALGGVVLIRPFRSAHKDNVLEIVSNVKISERLKVKYDDEISVYVKCAREQR